MKEIIFSRQDRKGFPWRALRLGESQY